MGDKMGDQESLKRSVEDLSQVENDDQKVKKLKLEEKTSSDTVDSCTDVSGDLVSAEIIETVQNDQTDRKVTEGNDELQEQQNGSLENVSQINFNKKKKCALLLSYCGSGYSGMQRNPGVQTIEEDLTNALLKAKAITEDASRNYGKMSFQRCARTDKGVSAARQVVSLKHMVPEGKLLPEINKYLKPQIRVFDLKKVTRGFDCKKKCSSRRYEYLMPTLAFSQSYAHTAPNFRITDEIRERIEEVLSKYEGTHNFHNFTSGRSFKDESSKRYMLQLNIAGEPCVKKDVEFIVLQIQGQSFMQHQIRKMIGLLIAIIRNCTKIDAIDRSFEEPKMDIPKAPGLGLILDQVYFEDYNKKFKKTHDQLEWSSYEKKISEFKEEYIYSNIIETEIQTKSMLRWLNSLSSHTYSSVGMGASMTDKSSVDDDESTMQQDSQSSAADVLAQEHEERDETKENIESKKVEETDNLEDKQGDKEEKEINEIDEQ